MGRDGVEGVPDAALAGGADLGGDVWVVVVEDVRCAEGFEEGEVFGRGGGVDFEAGTETQKIEMLVYVMLPVLLEWTFYQGWKFGRGKMTEGAEKKRGKANLQFSILDGQHTSGRAATVNENRETEATCRRRTTVQLRQRQV